MISFDDAPTGGLVGQGGFKTGGAGWKATVGGGAVDGGCWAVARVRIDDLCRVRRCRGIAHIRNTVDLTADIHARVSHAIHAEWDCVRFATHEGSVFVARLDRGVLPAGLTDDEQDVILDEAAIQLAQRLAVKATTWRVPALTEVSGFDPFGLASIEIEPRVIQGGRILSYLPDADGTVVPDRDSSALMGEIRAQVGPNRVGTPCPTEGRAQIK